MSVWLVRAGKRGVYESAAIDKRMASIDYPEVPDLNRYASQRALRAELRQIYPDETPAALRVHAQQLWAFCHEIQIGDVVVMPLRDGDSIELGVVEGPYEHRSDYQRGTEHSRTVRWLRVVSLSEINANVLESIKTSRTLARIERNDTERQIWDLISMGGSSSAARLWIDDLVDYFKELGGEAHYSELYARIETYPRRPMGKEWQAVVRRTIEEHSSDTTIWAKRRLPDLFRSVEGIGKGVWALRGFERPVAPDEALRGPLQSRGGTEPIQVRDIPRVPPRPSENGAAPIDPEARRQALERRNVAHYRIVRALADRAEAAGLKYSCSQYADVLCDNSIFEMKSIGDDEIAQVRAAIGQLYHYLFMHRGLPGYAEARLWAVFDKPIDEELRAFLVKHARIGVIWLQDKKFVADEAARQQLPWLF